MQRTRRRGGCYTLSRRGDPCGRPVDAVGINDKSGIFGIAQGQCPGDRKGRPYAECLKLMTLPQGLSFLPGCVNYCLRACLPLWGRWQPEGLTEEGSTHSPPCKQSGECLPHLSRPRYRSATLISALKAGFAGCAPKRACGRSPKGRAFMC